MTVTIDGTNGITTPSPVVVQGSTSGSITLAAPAVAGSNTITLPAGTGTAAVQGVSTNIVSGTAKAYNWNSLTTNTYLDFTDIPSWAKRITVLLSGVSTSGTSIVQIQLGTSGGVVTTGYLTAGIGFGVSSMGTTSASSGFIFNNAAVAAAANAIQGQVIFSSFGNNTWTGNGVYALNTSNQAGMCAGAVPLGGTLDRVRITTVNGTDTFDAGSINILYE